MKHHADQQLMAGVSGTVLKMIRVGLDFKKRSGRNMEVKFRDLDRNKEVKLTAPLGNNDRPTNQPTDRQTGS